MSANHQLSAELKVAEQAAREAGSVLMSFFGKDYRIEEKGKGNPVTTADLQANTRIREIIRRSYPRDAWLSEEDKDDLQRLKARRVWVVDPMDGTKEFIQGIPQFTVSIGLVIEGQPVLGAVYNPVNERLFLAVKDGGAALNDRALRVSSREKMEGALLLISRSEPTRKFEPFAHLCRLEPVGSIAHRLALVASGEGDGTLTFRSVREWDICAGVLIVQEAGGVVLDGAGHGLAFNQQEARCRGVVASNGVLAHRLQGLLAEILSTKS